MASCRVLRCLERLEINRREPILRVRPRTMAVRNANARCTAMSPVVQGCSRCARMGREFHRCRRRHRPASASRDSSAPGFRAPSRGMRVLAGMAKSRTASRLRHARWRGATPGSHRGQIDQHRLPRPPARPRRVHRSVLPMLRARLPPTWLDPYPHQTAGRWPVRAAARGLAARLPVLIRLRLPTTSQINPCPDLDQSPWRDAVVGGGGSGVAGQVGKQAGAPAGDAVGAP